MSRRVLVLEMNANAGAFLTYVGNGNVAAISICGLPSALGSRQLSALQFALNLLCSRIVFEFFAPAQLSQPSNGGLDEFQVRGASFEAIIQLYARRSISRGPLSRCVRSAPSILEFLPSSGSVPPKCSIVANETRSTSTCEERACCRRHACGVPSGSPFSGYGIHADHFGTDISRQALIWDIDVVVGVWENLPAARPMQRPAFYRSSQLPYAGAWNSTK